MLILFSGDWQVELNNLERCKTAVDQMISILRKSKERPRYLVHLGDIKEHWNPIDLRVTNFILDAMKRIQRNCEKVFYLRGNHDSISPHDGVDSCIPLIRPYVNQIADESFQKANLGEGINLFMVPYFRERERQLEEFRNAALEVATRGGYSILAFHNTLTGCDLNFHFKGVGYSLDEIYASKYDLCISGHIHRPQILPTPSGTPIYYAGSPFCVDWAEANDSKSLLVVTAREYDGELLVNRNRIASVVPGWYDPDVPGFNEPETWEGRRVRIRIPIHSDPVKELQAARDTYEKKYPGAELHLVPEHIHDLAPVEVDLKQGDEALLRSYFQNLRVDGGASLSKIAIEQSVTYLKKYLPGFSSLGVKGLVFQECVAENVLCFEKVQFDFERTGLTLITGVNHDWENRSNGAGKSSFVSLPFLALFGKTFKSQVHDEWARQDTEAPALITLRLQLASGQTLRIERGRRPALLRAFLDDKEVTMGRAEATQVLIERLTNLTWSVLTNAVYIGQREIGSVFGTDKDRKELFSRLLGLERFLDAHAAISKARTRCAKAIEEYDSDIEEAIAMSEEAGSGLEEIRKALSEVPVVEDRNLAVRELSITNVKGDIRVLEKEISDLDPELDANQKRYEVILFRKADVEGQIHSWQSQIDDSTKVKATCNTCGSKVSVETLENFQKERESLINLAGVRVDELEAKMNRNRLKRRALIDKIQANRAAIQKLQKQLSALQTEFTQMQSQAEARQRLEKLEASKQSRIERLTRLVRIHRTARAAAVQEHEFVSRCLQAVSRDGLPLFLCNLTMPPLNRAAERYSEIFTEGEIGVRFAVNEGDIDIETVNLHGGNNVKDQSAGEMRMAGIITAFAFRDVLVPHNILVLDEPSEGLDAPNAIELAKGLTQVMDRFKHVLVISHSVPLLSELEPDSRIAIHKQDGIAQIKVV